MQKKLVIGADFHQKFHQNQVISQKYTILQKGLFFFLGLTVSNDPFMSIFVPNIIPYQPRVLNSKIYDDLFGASRNACAISEDY